MNKVCYTFRMRRGTSLVETVIAVFILAFLGLAIGNLFHSAIRASGRAGDLQKANLITARQLARLRTLDAAGLAAVDGTTVVEDGISLELSSWPKEQMSPCRNVVEMYPVTDRRTLTQSLYQVRIRAQWGSESLETWSMVAPVPRELDRLELRATPPPGTLSQNDEVTFTATAYDTSNQEIQDLKFQFYVVAGTGNGTIIQRSPTGRSAVFKHILYRPPFSPIFAEPGTQCRLAARALYRGQEYITTYDLDLGP